MISHGPVLLLVLQIEVKEKEMISWIFIGGTFIFFSVYFSLALINFKS
tara:strand:- start:3214 stop:3357 length:144 start_codon:yes stop_codon:yes gene_type:complete